MITAFVFLHRRVRFPSSPPSFGFVAVVIIYLIIFKQNWKPIEKKKEEVKKPKRTSARRSGRMKKDIKKISKKQKEEVEEEEEDDEEEEEEEASEEEEEEEGPEKEEESSSSSSEEDEDEDDQKEMQKKAPIEKKKEEVKIMKKEVEKFQYRSSMVSFVKLLKNIKFTEIQKKEIKKSPFSSLILAIADAQWDDAYFKKSDHDALKLVEQYEGQRGRFKLGAKLVKITAREFGLIFGIKSGPIRIELSTKPRMPEIPFAYEISVKRIMTNISLREFFNTKVMAGESEEDAKDVARVLTLYLISTVFLPSTASRISWSYFPFIEDLEKCSSYAWSTFFTEELIKQLNTNFTTPTVAGGCIVGLLVKELELEPNDEEQEFLGLTEGDEEEKDTNEATKTEDVAHNDTNREQNRIKILEDEIKRLREENEQKDKTICELKKRILDLEDETVPDLSFEVETSHVERNFMANEVKDKEVEICEMLIENEIMADKLEKAEENLDDMAAHCITQQVKEGKEVELPDEQRKDEDEEIFPNEGAILLDEMVSDVQVDKTINETVLDILHDQDKPKKKTGKTPSSMTNRVKAVYTRVEKRDSSYIYPEDGKKKKDTEDEKKKKKDTEMWKAENTKLGHFLPEKDMNLLKRFHQLYQGHEIHCEPVWQNNKTNEIVPLKSIIKLLQEGDVGNQVKKISEEWRHYNSFRSRRKVDPYLQDAITVKNCVEEIMKELELKKKDLPQFDLLSQARPIFKFGAPIKSVDETPQQNELSVDCGIFVCYIIKRLAEKREIPQTLRPRDVAEFRVHMVHKFLNDDQRTWTEDLWKDHQLANEIEQ
ncbi:hypothetical protein RHGRI_024499 [Rhododendron griersonianum]|uniref:Ubiquitin-like protease family profile domain-containing protein n=1 Tax=Rhododendron griersonianum TaxID=479676 RepID=A0AAV6JAY6_9ERIC|nr:hypothetical protein RHGRI_024499 [Rhododendron griersonianum]